MTDRFGNHQAGLSAPAERHIAVTPSDSTDLTFVARGLYTGSGGTIVVVDKYGTEATYRNVPSGVVLPIRAARVRATNTIGSPTESTTAVGIIALS